MKLNVDKQVKVDNTDDRQNIKLQNVNKLIEEGLKMTPAEKAGLKVGDVCEVVQDDTAFEKGVRITFYKDDGSTSPIFTGDCRYNHADGEMGAYINLEYIEKVEENNMNKEFKAMKFWIGDDPELSKRVHKLLKGLGYGYKMVESRIEEKAAMLVTTEDGAMWYREDYDENFTSTDAEEINIDWMRTGATRETIELNGKTYIKSELEEALSHIRPIEENV